MTEDLELTYRRQVKGERGLLGTFEFARLIIRQELQITKANIIKVTDGKFLDIFYAIAKEYLTSADDWYIDIMTAKLVDEKKNGLPGTCNA